MCGCSSNVMVMLGMELKVKIPVKVGAEQLLNITCTFKIIKVKMCSYPILKVVSPVSRLWCASNDAVSPSNQF